VGNQTAAAQLVQRFEPVYPELAIETRVSGTVRLHAILAKDGSVEQLEVVSGHPLLVQSAMDAVKHWKYRPTLLDGEAVEVDTLIDVVYSLTNGGSQQAASQTKLYGRVSPELRADVIQLLKANHAQEKAAEATSAILQRMRPQMFPHIKDETLRGKITDAYVTKFLEVFKKDEFQEGIVVAYAKYFDDDDVKELAKFYESRLGQKFNEAVPNLTADMMELGQKLAQDSLPRILKELCKEYPDALGGQLPDCPAPDVEKKSQLLPEVRKPLGDTPAGR